MRRFNALVALSILVAMLGMATPLLAQNDQRGRVAIDLGNPASEANFTLAGWGAAEDIGVNPFPSPSGDYSKRFQLLDSDNSVTFPQTLPRVSYLLSTEVESGACDDSFHILVNGRDLYSHTPPGDGVHRVLNHTVTIPAAINATAPMTVTFRNASTDGCGRAAVYNIALTPLAPASLTTTTSSKPAKNPTPGAFQPGLLAVLKDGTVWLMRADGSKARPLPGPGLASNPTGPRFTSFEWAPNGRYLLLLRQDDNTSRSILVYNPVSNELRTLIAHERAPLSDQAPAWALDEDTILVPYATTTRFQIQLKKLHLDGTVEDFATYTNRSDCGGLDGPASPSDQQFMLISRYYASLGYPTVQWSTKSGWMATNMTCHESRKVDLSSGTETDPGLTPLTVSSAGLLAGGVRPISGLPMHGTSGIYDPATGALRATVDGVLPVWSPDGKALYVLRTTTLDSARVRDSDDGILYTLQINKVELWRVDANGANQRRVATLRVYAGGLPAISSDGKTMVLATVQNLPKGLNDVPPDGTVSGQWMKGHTPEIHLQRVDLTTGKVARIAVGAYAPQLQPTGGAATPQASTPPPNAAAQPSTPVPSFLPSVTTATSTDGLIAFTGEDGNIWLMRPDGSSKRQVTTDGTPDRPHLNPGWSLDGTKLVFINSGNGFDGGGTVALLQHGSLQTIPTIRNCRAAAFMPDGKQLALTCGADSKREQSLTQDQLNSDPSVGYITTANLDGSDWKVVVPYHTQDDGGWPGWVTPGFGILPGSISVASDGAVLVNWTGNLSSGIDLKNSPGENLTRVDAPGNGGSVWGRFASDGKNILAIACPGCHIHGNGAPGMSVATMNRNGDVIQTIYTPDPNSRIANASMSPDGSRISFTVLDSNPISWTKGVITVLDPASGKTTALGRGAAPAWQPHAARIALSNEPGGATAPPQATNPPTARVTARPSPQATQRAAMATPVVPAASSGGNGAVPASGQLAYGVKTGGHWDVWVHDFGSGQNLQLTADPTSDQWAPAYSHDGSQLAFLSDASGSNQVWLMNPDGGNQRQVSDWGGDQITSVAWSADDQTFYITVQGSTAKRVMQMPVGGGELTDLIPPSSSGAVAVPGQDLLVYVTGSETTPQVTLAPADNPGRGSATFEGDAPAVGGNIIACQVGDKGSRRIVLHDFRGNALNSPEQKGDDSDPALTPDGSVLFYVAESDGSSQVIARNTDSGAAAAVDVAVNDEVWYIAWRLGS